MPPPKRSKSVKEMIPLRDESSFDRTRKHIMPDTSPDYDSCSLSTPKAPIVNECRDDQGHDL